MNKFATTAALVLAPAAAFATGPSAGDLSNLTPDVTTILTAIGAVGVVLISVQLAIKGFRIVQRVMGRGA